MRTIIPLVLPIAMFGGCQSHPPKTTTTSTTTTTVEPSSRPNSTATLDGLVANVQQAKSAQSEADALRALRKYETENGMTYTVRTFNRDTDELVAGPTASNAPLRVEVSIFRGRDLLRTFSFLPKDPRNLALLGE